VLLGCWSSLSAAEAVVRQVGRSDKPTTGNLARLLGRRQRQRQRQRQRARRRSVLLAVRAARLADILSLLSQSRPCGNSRCPERSKQRGRRRPQTNAVTTPVVRRATS